MPIIPNVINGVQIQYPTTANLDVVADVISALKRCVRGYAYGRVKGTSFNGVRENPDDIEAAGRIVVSRIYISSASDGTHSTTSRHYMHKAVDLSRINGKRFSEYYPTDAAIRALVKTMQNRFEGFTPKRRENFGPAFLRKLGQPLNDRPAADVATLAEQHRTHIHFSVN